MYIGFYAVYTDKTALPAVGKSVIWKYKLIYLYHDEETGSMSDEASIAVVWGWWSEKIKVKSENFNWHSEVGSVDNTYNL